MVVINSPNNPSGSVYTEAEYRALAAVLEKYPESTFFQMKSMNTSTMVFLTLVLLKFLRCTIVL